MEDPLDENWTTWDTVTDYAIGGVVGVGSLFLGLSRGVAVLIALATFLAVVLGKQVYRRWKGTGA